MERNGFKHSLGQRVKLVASEERGTIIARSESLTSEDQYLLRYLAGDGCQRESWFGESGISSEEPAELEDHG
jgi:hypothetical protein